MLIFLRHKLAFLATPKTGTTAVEMALKSRAEIVFSKSRKHITALRYANKIAPFLEDTFDVRPASVAVMRDPVDQIRSWYKYRSQKRLDGTELSTKGISFEQFVREVISEDAPARAPMQHLLDQRAPTPSAPLGSPGRIPPHLSRNAPGPDRRTAHPPP